MVDFSHKSLIRADRPTIPTLGADYPVVGEAERLPFRARPSGFSHIDRLWEEATQQAAVGWLSTPVELGENGGWETAECGQYNIAFRFAVLNSIRREIATTLNTDGRI